MINKQQIITLWNTQIHSEGGKLQVGSEINLLILILFTFIVFIISTISTSWATAIIVAFISIWCSYGIYVVYKRDKRGICIISIGLGILSFCLIISEFCSLIWLIINFDNMKAWIAILRLFSFLFITCEVALTVTCTLWTFLYYSILLKDVGEELSIVEDSGTSEIVKPFIANSEFIYTLGCSILYYFSYKASRSSKGFQSMITFFLSMIPSELPIHFLFLQLSLSYYFIPSLFDKYKRQYYFIDNYKENQSQKRLRITKLILMIISLYFTCFNLFYYGKMSFQNIKSIWRFRGLINKAGIKNTSKWTLKRFILILFPFTFLLRRNIRKKSSQVYAIVPKSNKTEIISKKLKLDIFWHEKRRMDNAPVFMYIHGGGWVTGHRKYHSLPLLYHIARNGWIVVTINYRLCPKVRAYPDQLMDCKLALKWIKENIHQYGGNPDFITCGGESAGGHLSTLLTLTANEPKYQPNFEHIDTTIKGCVNLYGVMDFTDYKGFYAERGNRAEKLIQKFVMKQKKTTQTYKEFQNASPVWRVKLSNGNIPRIMIVHGTIDTLVPYEDGKNFFKELTDKREMNFKSKNIQGISSEIEISSDKFANKEDIFIKLPDTHHAFNFIVSAKTLALSDTVIDFLNDIYSKRTINNAKL